ncbi:hypothetical protein ACFL1R_07220 [Candidatus Latescibacterota bacterium]
MAQKEKNIAIYPQLTKVLKKHGLLATLSYSIIAVILTFPLIFRMNSSVYGFYDHISTDMFASIHYYFWLIQHSIFTLKSSPFITELFAAPFGSRINFVNFTGFIMFPVSAVFGYLFSNNFIILINLVISGLGMFYLVKYLTNSPGAGFIAGIIYAFCPNMMVRSYTTFDSTQVQWIPFYTLYLLKFIDNRTWKNAFLTGAFLACNILFAIPYYLVYLPVHTAVLLIAYAIWHVFGEKRGFHGLLKDITTPRALKGWMKTAGVLGIVFIIFLLYYKMVFGESAYDAGSRRTTTQLEELALQPSDYLMPHPRSAILKSNIKESYWNAKRPGKDPDSFVAYIGYIALALAVAGLVKGQRGPFKWIMLAGIAVAFWSTLGILSPSGLIYRLYAPFARRILIYKVFVQFGVAGLAGMGYVFLVKQLKDRYLARSFLALVSLFILLEYTLVPPALSVDLRHNPEVYERIEALPDDTILIETPMRRRYIRNLYQGYVYYQTIHHKKLFNPYFSLSRVPEHIRPLYTQMEVPLEAQEYANLAALRHLGVTHLTYHLYIGTKTVQFRSFDAPGLIMGAVEGLTTVYRCGLDPFRDTFQGPFDYTFADLYEITADPCPVALTFDYHSPYEQVPGLLRQDLQLPLGWASALVDTTGTFFYPLEREDRLIRLMRQGGRVTAANMSDTPVDISLTFIAESPDSNRVIETKWNNGPQNAQFVIGPEPVRCTVENLHLDNGERGVLSIWSTKKSFLYTLEIGAEKNPRIPTMAILSDFRVIMKK